MRLRMVSIALGVIVTSVALHAAADTQVCILRGAGGESRYDERFQQWSDRLSRVLVEQCGVAPEHVRAFPANAGAPAISRESVGLAMAEIAASIPATDTFILVIVGHGSMQLEPKFMVAGPDISASDFKGWIDAIPAGRQVILNTTSASSGFINTLSRADRVIVTSTRASDQPNATEFMEQLLLVLESNGGDRDRNGELTLSELCDAASASTVDWYERQDFVVTENALLDDNGDALGTRLPRDGADGASADGALASTLVIRSNVGMAGADPAKLAAYREALAAVAAWKQTKATADPAAYWTRLEELLLQAARLNPALEAPAQAASTGGR